VENIPLFRDAVNQQLRQQFPEIFSVTPVIQADLIVTVAELGKPLFRELKLLEPCGMGNPAPKLLIRNCRFEVLKNFNQRDIRQKEVKYMKTKFNIYDQSSSEGFPGIWWGHSRDDLPEAIECDAIVELDFNTYQEIYEVRLIAVCRNESDKLLEYKEQVRQENLFIDWRGNTKKLPDSSIITLQSCPHSWHELQQKYQQAIARKEKLALAYPAPKTLSGEAVLEKLIGIAKYLSRTEKSVPTQQLQKKLKLTDTLLKLGLKALINLGFRYTEKSGKINIIYSLDNVPGETEDVDSFLEAIAEAQFQQQYFYQVPLADLEIRLSR
jgi:single-stranded-DNA-specific exonuclease